MALKYIIIHHHFEDDEKAILDESTGFIYKKFVHKDILKEFDIPWDEEKEDPND